MSDAVKKEEPGDSSPSRPSPTRKSQKNKTQVSFALKKPTTREDAEDAEATVSERRGLLSAMKKVLRHERRASSSLSGAESTSNVVPAASNADAESEVVSVELLDYDPDHPEVLLSRVVDVPDEMEGPLRAMEKSERAAPPWWLRRWGDLLLFRNSTREFSGINGAPAVQAALMQLHSDVAAAQSLTQSIQDKSPGAPLSNETDQPAEETTPPILPELRDELLLDCAPTDGGAALLSIVSPPWCGKGVAEHLSRQLSEQLGAHLTRLVDAMNNEGGRSALQFLHSPDSGGFDGTQWRGLCPLLERIHAGLMAKVVLEDLFAPPAHLLRGRAQLIEEGFRKQTPLVHIDYITEEQAKSAYDPQCLLPPRTRDSMPHKNEQAKHYRSFALHIQYIRFQPPANNGTLPPLHFGAGLEQLPVPSAPTDPATQSSNTIFHLLHHHHRHPSAKRSADSLINFSREEELYSQILDNYEPYRMMQLNLLPYVKNRQFYADQLANLKRQQNLSAEQRLLRDTLTRLHHVACELERYYIRSMLVVWRQISTLRGEMPSNPPPPPSEVEVTVESAVSSTLRLSVPTPRISGPARALFANDIPLLQEASKQLKRFRWFLRRHGELSEATYTEGDDLIDFVPVVEGADTPLVMTTTTTTAQLDASQRFQVLVFARMSALAPPQFVGSTSPRTLSAAHVLFLNETFELCALQEPQEILLHLVPVGNTGEDRVLATVSVRPSLTRVHLLRPLEAPIPFTYRDRTHGRHTGGVVRGVISLVTSWTTTEGMTLDEMEELFLRGDADPMDPQYEPLLAILRAHYMETRRRDLNSIPLIKNKKSGTRLFKQSEILENTSDEHDSDAEMKDENDRLALLKRRWRLRVGHTTPRNKLEAQLMANPLPLDETESKELRLRLRRAISHDPTPFLRSARYDAIRPLSCKARLEEWQQRLLYIKTHHTSTRKLEDHEVLERLVIFPKLHMPKFSPITPESQLNPRRESRPKANEINRDALTSKQDSRIVVHIMKATALPQRADGTPLEPFVEVSFVYETVHSRSEVGTAPAWFETLNIPFYPPDFDDETLSLIDDDIVITLYDKVEIPLPPTTVVTGAVSHETHYRTERRLLGTLRIPFFSLYEADQARMEGQFALDSPRWILGYRPPDSPSHTLGRPTATGPSLQLYVALCPPLRRRERRELDQSTIGRLVNQLNVSAQLQNLHNIAIRWRSDALRAVKRLSSLNPVVGCREVVPFVFCTTGDLTLACRYLLARGGPPPVGVRTAREAIRFVSLLPFRLDMLTWGDEDVWSTNAELLRTRCGDYEELSLLLAHFLRFLEPDEVTFVVSGYGMVHNRAVMVLHSFGGELHLIDPHTGAEYPVHDPQNPFFHDVHMVISHDQLWANVQLSGTPHRMDWNLQDRRLWLPCFDHSDANVHACLPFIAPLQREILTFSPPYEGKEREIEHELRKAVRRALVVWRNNRQPAFHHGIASVLTELLREAEKERCEHASARQEHVTLKAAELVNEYFSEEVLREPRQRRRGWGRRSNPLNEAGVRIMGCPVNDSYVSDDPSYQLILQRVFETAVHEAGTNAVSFAIAVHVRGYTGQVYSMWVFLAALYESAAPLPMNC